MKSLEGKDRKFGPFRSDGKGPLEILLPFLIGIGIMASLTEILRHLLPTRWDSFVLTILLLAFTVICWVCKQFERPFLSFYRWFFPLMLVGNAMALRATMIEMIVFQSTWNLRMIGIGVGLLTAAAVFLYIKKKKRDPSLLLRLLFSLLMGFLAFGFSFGGLLEINVLADGKTPQQMPVQVIQLEWEYRYSNPRVHGGTLYFVVIEENSLTRENRFPVSKRLYDSLETGDQVRLVLHPGALGTPWLECEAVEGA